MDDVEEDGQELLRAQLEIARQSFAEKAARIRALEAEVRYLKDLLNGLALAPKAQPAPRAEGAAPRTGVPRRWLA